MSIGSVETGTTSADAGAAAIPPGAVAEVARQADAGDADDGRSAAEILAKLDTFDPLYSGPDDEPTERDAPERGEDGKFVAAADAETKAAEPESDEAVTKRFKEINRKSLERMKARRGIGVPTAQAAQTPAVAAATAAAKAAEAAAAKPAEAAKDAEKPNEVAQAVRDVLAQIQRLSDDDEAATAAAASGTADKGAEARAAELKAIRATVEKIGEGLKDTSDLKTTVTALQAQLKHDADEANVTRIIADQIDAIAADAPTVASGAKHEIQIEQNGTKKTVRMTGAQIVRYQAERFFEKYKRAPDLKELARRIEKKLSPEKNGEKTPTTRKTVSTSQSSPPAARQGPDKRSAKEAEADFYKRLGMADEIRD